MGKKSTMRLTCEIRLMIAVMQQHQRLYVQGQLFGQMLDVAARLQPTHHEFHVCIVRMTDIVHEKCLQIQLKIKKFACRSFDRSIFRTSDPHLIVILCCWRVLVTVSGTRLLRLQCGAVCFIAFLQLNPSRYRQIHVGRSLAHTLIRTNHVNVFPRIAATIRI